MDKYRSKVSYLTIIINILLYAILITLVAINNSELLFVIIILVLINVGLLLYKFLKPIYFLEKQGLVIIEKKNRHLVLYKNIKIIEKNSNEIGLLCGYGFNRLLVSTGKGNSQNYLITPEKEDLFIFELEKRVEEAKKAQTKNR